MEAEVSEGLRSLRRSKTQRRVLMCLIRHGRPMATKEIARELNLTENAVSIALMHLKRKGLVEKVSKGVYTYNLGAILAPIVEVYLSSEGGKRG